MERDKLLKQPVNQFSLPNGLCTFRAKCRTFTLLKHTKRSFLQEQKESQRNLGRVKDIKRCKERTSYY